MLSLNIKPSCRLMAGNVWAASLGAAGVLVHRKEFMRRIAIVAACLAVLVVPSTALAQSSSTCNAYHPQAGSCSNLNTNDNTSTEPLSSSTLPFTGLDVLLLVVGGGTLAGTGLVVRRLSRRIQ